MRNKSSNTVSSTAGRRSTRVVTALLGGAVVAATWSGAGGVAAAKPAAGPIGPDQSFVGLVNHRLSAATVKVVCPGPLRLGQTGEPASGQTLSVLPRVAAASRNGFTGAAGDSVVAEFVAASTGATSAETFTQYGTLPITSTFQLPCSGSGRVVFAPEPTSPTARSTSVSVTYLAVCNTPVCPLGAAERQSDGDGVIAGELGFEGGPSPGGFHPTAGRVDIAGPKLTRAVDVPSSGKFSAVVPAGRYTLIGCGGTQDEQCGPSQKVTVHAGATKHVRVVWLLAP